MLKPLLPGLGKALEDQQVSEIMINGPDNVWIEKNGKLDPWPAPDLDSSALERAAIHIARPLGLDPALSPLVDARLDDGSRVAICMPPASPIVAITVRRFGGRSFSTDDLMRQGVLAKEILSCSRKHAAGAAEHPCFRRDRERENDPPQCSDRIVARKGTDYHYRRCAGVAHQTQQLSSIRSSRTKGYGDDSEPGATRVAPPTGSYRHGRGSRRGSCGPVASSQYRPRWVADYYPCQ